MNQQKFLHTNEPILFCIFRGLENTKKSFETISIVKPKILYIASDGPLLDSQKEEVQIIRDWVIASINWDCQIYTLFRKKNLGVKKSITEAISWIANKENYFFVIECDCYINPLFIKLAPLVKKELENSNLKHYNICSYSRFFSKKKILFFQKATLVMIWGWYVKSSTWKSFKIDKYPKLLAFFLLIKLIKNKLGIYTIIFWLAKLFDCFAEIDKTWGNRYAIHCMVNEIPSFIPNHKICNNIGIGDKFATNANSLYSIFSNSKFDPTENFEYDTSKLIRYSLNIGNDEFFGQGLYKIYSKPGMILIKAILVLIFGSNSKIIYILSKKIYKSYLQKIIYNLSIKN